jgi:hypothetical protein
MCGSTVSAGTERLVTIGPLPSAGGKESRLVARPGRHAGGRTQINYYPRAYS